MDLFHFLWAASFSYHTSWNYFVIFLLICTHSFHCLPAVSILPWMSPALCSATLPFHSTHQFPLPLDKQPIHSMFFPSVSVPLDVCNSLQCHPSISFDTFLSFVWGMVSSDISCLCLALRDLVLLFALETMHANF
ncbi:hypothetical protein BJ741DRAFT_32212 [Chytriomyces cf. hyalinus JEL632]|nr:hypothetical protein BJ741DRAFT_32212 [Chytriomyces cf. hyalinus JEL632]